MVKMYLLLKLMQVPWSIKTTLRFVSSSLTCTLATYLFLDHLIKTNQKPTKKGCVCVERETAENRDFQQFVHFDVFRFTVASVFHISTCR